MYVITSYALFSNTTGYNNTSVGFRSLNNNTIGANNVALGMDALRWLYGVVALKSQ